MNYTKKISSLLFISLFFTLQFIIGSNLSNVSESTKIASFKVGVNTAISNNSFYQNYNSNWKNLTNFNASNYWAKKETVIFTAPNCEQNSPTQPALGFNVFTLESLTLKSNETEGPVATGGDLTIAGNYQVATNQPGTFLVNNTTIGLLVGGKVIYKSGNSLQVNQNTYVKIGNNQGSNVWYKDQNNAYSNIRITPSSNYNSSPNILLQTNANNLNVSSTNNPVFESNLIDFSTAFQTLETNSTSLSQNTHNAQLTNPNGQSISNTNLPNQVKINLQDGINYLSITGDDLNDVDVFTYNQQPSASKVLVINIDTSGNFNWDVWNQAGVGQQNASYIIYNFYNTTELNIKGNSTIVGTVFAPFADIEKKTNNSNIEGQVIGKSFNHESGEVHFANFKPAITTCSVPNGVPPTAEFSINNNEQCFETNEFSLNNTSNTGATAQPADPITYAWNFGDGTTSTIMNPTKTYANSGTFTVTLVATNTFGSDTTTKQITVKNAVTTPIITEATLTSAPGTVTREFTLDNDTNFDTFSWKLVNVGNNLYPNEKVVSFDFTSEGTFELVITVVKNGCTQSLTYNVVVASDEVSTGNNGGTESESLGDAISKMYVNRKKNSKPTEFVKSEKNTYNKEKLKKAQAYQGKNQTMLDMFPTELVAGNEANVTSPTDILDYTVADEVLSVDFSLNGKTKGVVLGIKTTDKIYNHTKASCDRLRGAEILNVETVALEGYNFLMQGIKQRSGVVEYAISFAVAKNNSENNYTIQTNWYVNEYTKFNDVYNFQVWATNPIDTKKMVTDILANLNGYLPVNQIEVQKVPKTFATKLSRTQSDLVIDFKSTETGLNTEISMIEIYSETTDKLEYRYNPINTELKQTLNINIKDGYEYEGLITINDEIQDAFYHSDGNWGLDYDKQYTTVEEYVVSNNFDREYNEDEYSINRNVQIKAVSEFDYLGIYKSLLPGNISADYSEYKYLAFTAKGSGLIELGLIKSSVENWKEQYRIMVDLSAEEQTYYVPFDAFTSTGSTAKLSADDLTTLVFTFLPVEAKTNDLDLTISDVKFTKTAALNLTVDTLDTLENNFMAYPNPSKGNVNLLLFSKVNTAATITLTDITGKEIYAIPTTLTTGKNEIDLNVKVKPGILFLKVSSQQINYGTSKIIFR